ncbi:hypothetical protein C7974DRAFT_378666 [Boeremia exigua]|uniref:uncharacterized protein n=1 Tax=Boeremia exigua TaxID=749465 RepID=UPI001E8E7267|nr:uncharacterized protein C7974DRAFT_378666 [Boeremia exigua]KAH6618470.1 hypothetical protein C7974DRAFT_378666 [Boeremia exigua]
MASEAYIRNQSEYLKAGNLSDLTLNFGDRSWKAHKAIACSHSQWFRRAVTGAFEESSSGIVTLQDEPEFADAIDCMVSYFYSAGYTISVYESSAALLHARVAIIADKYDCAALFEVAKAKLADCIGTADIDDWVAIADLIYNYTASELESHAQLRKSVVGAATALNNATEAFLRNEHVKELLRSNADLATDLLISNDQDW